ncbi:MAG: complex I NDUFA9 subunit family protein [Armatimonadetes bacterium]|nr:complex I NDUFA9 subunit family protein [Armatimonadota bacterium]
MKVGFTGATGFVGSHMVRRFVNGGHSVVCLVRRGEASSTLPGGPIRLREGDITNPDSLKGVFDGCELVVNLVGIIREVADATFERIHAEGTDNVLRAAEQSGVPRFIQMSSLGVRPGAKSLYHQTKWRAEESVRASAMAWTIFRPSVIFGRGDGFTTMLKDLISRAPVVPIVGSGSHLIQPVAIEDVTACFLAAGTEEGHAGQIYELGGPQQLRFVDIVRTMARQMGYRKPRVHLPLWLIGPFVRAASRVTTRFPLTTDQLIMLREDNVTDHNAAQEVFGLTLIPFSDGLKRLLRP